MMGPQDCAKDIA